MRFCTNCGKENDENAAFCIACGTSMAVASGTAAAGSQGTPSGTYYPPNTQGAPTGYTPVSNTPPITQNAPPAYIPPGPQSAPGAPYNQPGAQGFPNAPYYQTGPQGAPGTPYYPNGPYTSGGPNYPGGGPGKTNKTVVVIVSVIVGLLLIAGGILAYFMISNRDRDETSLSDSNTGNNDTTIKPSLDVIEPSTAPSVDSVPDVTDSAAPSSGAGLDIFDSATQDNVLTAFKETGIDATNIMNLQAYGSWYKGDVYTMTYEDSVVDLLLYDDGAVYSLETGGVQLYLIGYESFLFDDYAGSTTHYDESYPDNNYVFYYDRDLTDQGFSDVTIETSYDLDYVVELIDQNSGNLAIAFFVQAGQSMPMSVPPGDYIIQYAAGASWISVADLFGPDTVFYKSDSVYSINNDNSGAVITLDVNGDSGIASTQITIDDF